MKPKEMEDILYQVSNYEEKHHELLYKFAHKFCKNQNSKFNDYKFEMFARKVGVKLKQE